MSGNSELPFDNLLHEFDADQNPPGIGEGLEAEHRLDAKFHTPMILLHDIVQIGTRPDLDWVYPAVIEFVAHAHAAERSMAGFEAVQCDGSRLPVLPESFPEERSGCGHIPRAA